MSQILLKESRGSDREGQRMVVRSLWDWPCGIASDQAIGTAAACPL